jgi:hypothetical protein
MVSLLNYCAMFVFYILGVYSSLIIKSDEEPLLVISDTHFFRGQTSGMLLTFRGGQTSGMRGSDKIGAGGQIDRNLQGG